ncbi:hypothetical protein IAD21_02841 [Abditibacteriota bacterium]|nr:hypothetical protein IAD21_02841 [Abditibacteriota bacterium]
MSLIQFFQRDPIVRFALAAALIVGLGVGSRPAHAITRAGSTINNQAIGVYGDGSDTPRTVTSNSVQTVVQPVAFLNIAADGTKNATIGSTVNFSHTITNTGNDTDVFNLSATDLGGDDFQALPTVRADANGDGIPDGVLPITKTPSLQPGESYSFIVTGVAAGLASGNSAQILVRATSQFDSTVTGTNTDTLNITTNAQVSIVKSIDVNTGAPGTGPYTYTLTYTNSGNTAATNLTISDALVPGLAYVPGSGRWSTSGGIALTDAPAGDPAGINYNYGTVPLTVSAVIATVPANTSGRLSFQVNINNGVLPGILGNVALYTYNDGLSVLSLTPTNTVNLTVTQLASFTFTGDTVTSANQGASVDFSNVLTNTGSGNDTFDITLAPNTFPLGTTFQLLKGPSANLTPMTDTNGNGILDTGAVAPGANFTVTLRATLPTIAVGPGPYAINKIATSSINPLVIRTATDTLNGITGSTVDLTNDLAGALGTGAGPEATPVTTLNAGIGTTQRFTLYVKNTSAVADSFALLASGDTSFGAGLNLPTGFTLVFKSDAGAILTNTGLIQPGATTKVNADVFIPLGANPGVQNIYFRVISLLTGAFDTKLDAVNVGGLRSLALAPNGVGQVYPGNATVYTHTLTNTGNLPEGDGILSTIALATTDSVTGFSSVVYRDTNGNGILDALDPIVTNLNLGGLLLPGQSATLFVKVYAAAGTDLGSVNTTTLTATTTGGVGTPPASVSVRDSTTVIAGQITMQKTQALSNGGALVYSVNRITTGARPGAIIRYRIVATNVGTAPALGFVITDAIPAFTAYDQGDGSNSGTGVAGWTDGTTFHIADTPLTNGATGTLNFTIGDLAPGQSVTVTFGAKIQ